MANSAPDCSPTWAPPSPWVEPPAGFGHSADGAVRPEGPIAAVLPFELQQANPAHCRRPATQWTVCCGLRTSSWHRTEFDGKRALVFNPDIVLVEVTPFGNDRPIAPLESAGDRAPGGVGHDDHNGTPRPRTALRHRATRILCSRAVAAYIQMHVASLCARGRTGQGGQPSASMLPRRPRPCAFPTCCRLFTTARIDVVVTRIFRRARFCAVRSWVCSGSTSTALRLRAIAGTRRRLIDPRFAGPTRALSQLECVFRTGAGEGRRPRLPTLRSRLAGKHSDRRAAYRPSELAQASGISLRVATGAASLSAARPVACSAPPSGWSLTPRRLARELRRPVRLPDDARSARGPARGRADDGLGRADGRPRARLSAPRAIHVESPTRVNSWRLNKERPNPVNFPDVDPGERPFDRPSCSTRRTSTSCPASST